MRIAVAGSIATDHLLTFDGRFVEQLLPGGQAASAGPEARNHPGVGSSPQNVGATAGPAGSTTGTSVVAPQ